MPPAAPAPVRPKDRHKKRHMIGLRESIYKMVERAAGTNNRPTTWEIEVAIAYYLEHHMGMEIPEGVRRVIASHREE